MKYWLALEFNGNKCRSPFKGTMLARANIADIVVILKTLPTMESVNALGLKIVADLKGESGEIYGCVPRDFGCEIADKAAIVRLLVTILPTNAKLLEPDLHCAPKINFLP